MAQGLSRPLPQRGRSPVADNAFGGLPLAATEAAILLNLPSNSRNVRRGQEIISEGRRSSTVFIVTEGIAIRYRILHGGQRQIINFVLPGDFAGVPGCFFESALYSIKTLTNVALSPIPLSRLVKLFETHPRLAAKLFWTFTCELAIYAEHLIAVGRRSAVERVAHFLLELLTRMQLIGLADERSYRLPLTQETIGDALGLSIPYVNRVLRQLRDDGLVRISDQEVTIGNMDALATLADFEHTYLRPLSISDLMADRG